MTLTDLGTKILQKSLQVHDEISVGKKEGVLRGHVAHVLFKGG